MLSKPRSVSLPPASVDVIFLCDTYHHFEYPRSMNRSLYRALRPGGTLVLIDFVRVEGQSPKWILEHVRAGQREFSAELVAAGFVPVEEPSPVPQLKENYLVRFTTGELNARSPLSRVGVARLRRAEPIAGGRNPLRVPRSIDSRDDQVLPDGRRVQRVGRAGSTDRPPGSSGSWSPSTTTTVMYSCVTCTRGSPVPAGSGYRRMTGGMSARLDENSSQ